VRLPIGQARGDLGRARAVAEEIANLVGSHRVGHPGPHVFEERFKTMMNEGLRAEGEFG
jgi:hypothetical protein